MANIDIKKLKIYLGLTIIFAILTIGLAYLGTFAIKKPADDEATISLKTTIEELNSSNNYLHEEKEELGYNYTDSISQLNDLERTYNETTNKQTISNEDLDSILAKISDVQSENSKLKYEIKYIEGQLK